MDALKVQIEFDKQQLQQRKKTNKQMKGLQNIVDA